MRISVIGQSVRMAFSNIRNNKMRSFLTMLGIVIGVASVIALITIVSSVTGSVVDQFEALGAGTLTITAQGTSVKHGLEDEDIEKLSKVSGVEAVAPTASLSSTAVYDGTVSSVVQVEGRDAVYFQHNDDTIQSGRYFNSAEMGGETNVAIVDTDFVANVLGGNSSLGTAFILNGYEYTVIGIKSADSSVSSALSSDSDSGGTVIIPYRNVLKMSVMKNVTSVEVYYAEDADTATLEDALSACLNEIFEVTDDTADEAYSISSIDSLVATMTSTETLLRHARRHRQHRPPRRRHRHHEHDAGLRLRENKEIGLRKALGAQPYRIQLQFLIESITLSLLGGLIGIILGELTAYAGTVVMRTTFSVSYGAISLGAGFSAIVGIIFGWMPAKRASALNPIDALRSE